MANKGPTLPKSNQNAHLTLPTSAEAIEKWSAALTPEADVRVCTVTDSSGAIKLQYLYATWRSKRS